MNKNILVTVLVGSLFGMAACSQKPQPIQNQLSAQAAYIDRTVSECKAYLGGIDGIGKLKSASKKKYQMKKDLVEIKDMVVRFK